MILSFLNFFSSCGAAAGRYFSPFFLRLTKSEKAHVFLAERSVEHWSKALIDAKKSHLLNVQHLPVVYWIHVASAGELEQVIPIMRSLHENFRVVFFLTYFSPSAIPFLKNCPGLIGATSLIWENQNAYQKAIELLNIRRLILVRYDFWPLLISTFRKNSLPICIVAATLRKARSLLPSFFQHALRNLWFRLTDAVFLISESEKNLLLSSGHHPEKLFVAGDAKWNRAHERAVKVRHQGLSARIESLRTHLCNLSGQITKRIVVFGSPHSEELSILKKYLELNPLNITFIVAPSEVGSKAIESLESTLIGKNVEILKISELDRRELSKAQTHPNLVTVVVLDAFGFLAEAYALADLAIVGGGFDGQLHNVLEPAALLVPTLYGIHATRAPEAQILLTHNAAVGFANPKTLFEFLVQWGTLDLDDAVRTEMTQNLNKVRAQAESLFASLPDPSEVVCRALASKDALEAN